MRLPHLYAVQMSMRLLLGPSGNVRLEDSHEGIVEHELVVFRDDLEHILIVVLQAYIFMMLTIVYISMAHEHH